jgi:hypothetical protein
MNNPEFKTLRPLFDELTAMLAIDSMRPYHLNPAGGMNVDNLALLVSNVMLCGFACVMSGVKRVRVSGVGVMGCLFGVAGCMVRRSFLMMLRSMFVMLRRLHMMLMRGMWTGSSRGSFGAVFSCVLFFCRLLCHNVSSRITN